MIRGFFFFIFVVFAFPAPTLANDLIRQSLAWQIERSDIVVIAHVGERRSCGPEGAYMCVEVSPEVYLKGGRSDGGAPIYLLLDVGIYEARITDIDLSGRLMLLLKQGSSGLYQSVNGRFSVQKMEDAGILN